MKQRPTLRQGIGRKADMTLTQIQYFLEVCKTMNFTKAAQNLFVAQPSFSRQIQLLETELGVPLMVRNNRSVVLTEAGEIFRDEFSRILLNIEGAVHRVQEAGNQKKEIRVGLFYGLVPKNMYPFIQKLKIYFEGYKVYVDKYSTHNLKKAFDLGEVDIVISVEDIGLGGADSNFCQIQRVPAYLVYAKEMFPEGAGPYGLADFKGKKLICSGDTEAQALVKKQQEMAKNLGLEPTECLRVDNVVAALLFMESLQGYSLYLNIRAEEGLATYEIPGEQGGFSLLAYWKKDTPLALDTFFDHMIEGETNSNNFW